MNDETLKLLRQAAARHIGFAKDGEPYFRAKRRDEVARKLRQALRGHVSFQGLRVSRGATAIITWEDGSEEAFELCTYRRTVE